MTAPAVSVLIPVYNAEPHLDGAIQSVRAQTFTDFELVIVNDGSTDGSLDTMQRHAAEDPRVVVVDRPNAGIVAALNTGLAACRGEYIARMDGDDIAFPDRLERQHAYLEANPSVDLVGGHVEPFGDHAYDGMTLTYPLTHEAIDRHGLEHGSGALVHPTFFARRSLYTRLGGYLDGYPYAEDFDFLLRAAEAGKLACLPEKVIKYRLHGNQVTESKRFSQLQGMILALTDAGERRGINLRRSIARIWVVASWRASDDGNFASCLRCALKALATDPTRLLCYRAVARAAVRLVTRSRGNRTVWGTQARGPAEVSAG